MGTLVDCMIIGVIALISTIALIPAARALAWRFDAVDYPSGRRVNTRPVPRLGGIAITGGIATSLAIMVALVWTGVWETPFSSHPVLKVDWTAAGAGVLLMFAVGVIDDFYGLRPVEKLIGQTVSAIVVAASGVLFISVGNPFATESISLGWFAYPITVVYLVAFANIMNLIDGLDGLCSSITIVACVSTMFFAGVAGRTDVLLIGSAIIGACLGFLKFNRHPAQIFLGDSGSLTLGFLLGIISLVAIARSTLFTSLLVPFLAAGVPIIDTASAIIRRKRGHQSIGQADKGHIHHRLMSAGCTQEVTVVIMVGWTAFLATGGILITFIHSWIRYVIFAVLVIFSLVTICKLGVLRPVLAHKYNPRMTKRHVQDGTFTQEQYDKVREGADASTESLSSGCGYELSCDGEVQVQNAVGNLRDKDEKAG